jgi:hypothetical protein
MTLLDDIDGLTNDYAASVLAGTMVEPDGVVAVFTPTPTGNLGYGRDLSCTDDLTPGMDEVDENSPDAVQEALYRRITTPHGKLNDLGEDPDYGRSVVNFLHSGMSQVEIMAQSDLLAAECEKDDRVKEKSVKCIITELGQGAFEISIDGELESTGQTFSLVRTFQTGTELMEELSK